MSGMISSTLLFVATTAGSAIAQNVAANKAAAAARKTQAENLAAAKAAADKSTSATTTNAGDVSLESEEELADSAIRNKSTKNRLRVSTGLSLGSAGAGTGLRI